MLKFLAAFALFLTLIHAIPALNLECGFDPAPISGVTNAQIPLSLRISSDLDAQTTIGTQLDCGNGDYGQMQSAQIQETHLASGNFTCIYNNAGDYTANAKAVYLGIEYTCSPATIGIAQNPNPQGIEIFDISISPHILAGSLVTAGFAVKNNGNLDVSEINISVTDATDSNSLYSSEGNAISAGSSKTFEFQWDTANLGTGARQLIFSAYFGSSSFHVSKLVLIQNIPTIGSVNAITQATSTIISWNENPSGNYSITYWKTDGENSTISNSTFAQAHRQELAQLFANSNYRYIILGCNLVGCTNFEGSFETLAQAPSASPTPSATSTVTATSQPTISATPSTTPKPTKRPSVAPTFTPSPTISKIEIVKEEIGEVDIEELNKILDNETVREIVESKDKAIFNRIQITRNQTDPDDYIGERTTVRLIATTDSVPKLLTPKCYLSPQDKNSPRGANAAPCTCTENYGSNPSRFICVIDPKFPKTLGENYVIELSNEEKEKGIFSLALKIGRKPELSRYTIKAKKTDYVSIGGILLGIIMMGYAIYHFLSRMEKEHKAGETLYNHKKKLLEQMESIKFQYLKRTIDYEAYTKVMTIKQKELTEVNTRIAEFENKMADEKAPEGRETETEIKRKIAQLRMKQEMEKKPDDQNMVKK